MVARRDPRITWEVENNTRAWDWEDWWAYRGVCACGHPTARHMENSGCHGVMGRPRVVRPDNPRSFRRSDNTLQCQCRVLKPVVLVRNSGTVFRRAIRPGEDHPFNAAFGRVKPENVLEWAPGFPRCEFPECDVVGLINLRMYYTANDRNESVLSCFTHRPQAGVNNATASRLGVGVPKASARPVTTFGDIERSFPFGATGEELLRALGAPKAAENPDLVARMHEVATRTTPRYEGEGETSREAYLAAKEALVPAARDAALKAAQEAAAARAKEVEDGLDSASE